MAQNKLPYTSRTYEEFREEFMKITKMYYPDMVSNFGDASLSQWFMELFASISDELSYHIDRTYQETSLDSAQKRSSLIKIARNNGVKIPGRKPAIVEVELSCVLPLGKNDEADFNYAPIIKKGTLFSNGSVIFELVSDVNFKEQFNNNGVSNRQIIVRKDANGKPNGYTIKKLAVAVAGQSKIYKRVISDSDMKPFLNVTIEDDNIINIESIIFKSGESFNSNPPIDEFYVDEEHYKSKADDLNIDRFFEVDSLIDQYRFGYEHNTKNEDGYYNPIIYSTSINIDNENEPLEIKQEMKGVWKRLKNKFITEFSENGNLNIIFGAGLENEHGNIDNIETEEQFTKWMMSNMLANDYMGVCPKSGYTMFVLYRVGGGEMSNIAKGTLTSIAYLNACFPAGEDSSNDDVIKKTNDVRRSLKVTNTSQSYGGKDAPSNEELKYLIKYSNGSQNRCVTLKDYEAKINELPAKFGVPFRFGVTEENNKIVIYALGLDENGKLSSILSEVVSENILTYLENYRMINDFIEMKSGKIINVAFEIDVFIDRAYNSSEVSKRIIDKVYDYMDIQRHIMGEDIFLGDLMKEISQLEGVINLIDLRCYNKVYDNDHQEYSDDRITQALVSNSTCCDYSDAESDTATSNINQIDLRDSDMVLFSDKHSMFEIKDKNKDILVRIKER